MEKRTKDILSCAKRVLDEEAQAILNLKSTLDESFVKAVETILRCKGRLIIIAIGKIGTYWTQDCCYYGPVPVPLPFISIPVKRSMVIWG